MTAVSEEVRARFSQVLAARKTGKDLIALFDKLSDSTVFLPSVRPACFGMLVAEAADRVKPAEVPSLLAAVRRNEALAQVRQGYDRDESDRIAASLVRRVLTAAKLERDSLQQSIDALAKSKVTVDKGHVFSLATLAGMDHGMLDTMCDLTW